MAYTDIRHRFRVAQGDILQDPAHILVCPVNCVPGVLGAGLALSFAKAFPDLKQEHDRACRGGAIKIGKPLLVEQVERQGPPGLEFKNCPDIVLFPTKMHWKNPSRFDWIFKGLATLYTILEANEPDYVERIEIAMPALGCGLGGLSWEVVGPMISAWASGLPSRYGVTLYHTHGS